LVKGEKRTQLCACTDVSVARARPRTLVVDSFVNLIVAGIARYGECSREVEVVRDEVDVVI